MKRLVEVRAYRLKADTATAFHAAVVELAVPMLRRWGTDVVAFGPSLQEPDGYHLVRSYAGLADLDERQDAFYGSDEWKHGPREAIVSRIESYLSTALWLAPESIDDLRRANAAAS
ncbi:MAG: NIPSNAP family protein [Caldimonas sp.]